MKENAHADIKIHIGTNVCSTKFPIDKIASNINAIVTEAKRVSSTGHITFSSITPRVDNLVAAEKSNAVIEKMRNIATSNGCVFVSNQDNFLCKNGEMNEELLSLDGLHLSKLRTARLINNLKFNSLACCHIGRSQRPGGEARHASQTTTRQGPRDIRANTQAAYVTRRQPQSVKPRSYRRAPDGNHGQQRTSGVGMGPQQQCRPVRWHDQRTSSVHQQSKQSPQSRGFNYIDYC